ncbi:hypothetical protein NliqN6_5905 [Naganishia liquefaciens]|uniref:Uncharacterized protein n=1 Tax=Naganishia liquefaciens TaxID=104408 RepID=A0A8H3TYQ0_9TREE|nr:hypothetical protein NliqN6_5905 [Naganishia liquefaciens]
MSSQSPSNNDSAVREMDQGQAVNANEVSTPSKDEVIRMAADFYTKWETMANKVYDACDEPEEARRIMVDFWRRFKKDLPPPGPEQGPGDDQHSGPALSTEASEALRNYLRSEIDESFKEKWESVVERLAGEDGLSYLADIRANLSKVPIQSISELQEVAISNFRSGSVKSKSLLTQATPEEMAKGVSDWLMQYLDDVFKPRR